MTVTKFNKSFKWILQVTAGLLAGVLVYSAVCGPEARQRLADQVEGPHLRILGISTVMLLGGSE